MYRPRFRGALSLLVLLAVLATACSGSRKEIPASPMPGGASVAKNVGKIDVFGSAEPGTEESYKELREAKEIGFDELINYSTLNATPEGLQSYLDEAQKLGIGIVLSVKDLLGEDDLDPVNKALHQQYGKTTDEQVASVVKQFASHPAVKRILISDELPQQRDGDEGLNKWLPHLKARYQQIHQLTDKPVMMVLYWSGGDSIFYREVKRYADDLAIDYYPYPANPEYGAPSEASAIGTTLRRVAGDDGWFVAQAFGWGTKYHPEGKTLGFTKPSYAPPSADVMVASAKLAVEGGAKNLVFYSLADPNRSSVADMKEAVSQIRAASWWQS